MWSLIILVVLGFVFIKWAEIIFSFIELVLKGFASMLMIIATVIAVIYFWWWMSTQFVGTIAQQWETGRLEAHQRK